MLVLMLMLMLMSHASVDLFVLSFVLPCAYAYVASENQALIMLRGGNMRFRPATVFSFVSYLLNFSSNFVQMVTIAG